VKIFEEDLFAKILRNKVFAKKFEVLVWKFYQTRFKTVFEKTQLLTSVKNGPKGKKLSQKFSKFWKRTLDTVLHVFKISCFGIGGGVWWRLLIHHSAEHACIQIPHGSDGTLLGWWRFGRPANFQRFVKKKSAVVDCHVTPKKKFGVVQKKSIVYLPLFLSKVSEKYCVNFRFCDLLFLTPFYSVLQSAKRPVWSSGRLLNGAVGRLPEGLANAGLCVGVGRYTPRTKVMRLG
jgi:hypothetical protein